MDEEYPDVTSDREPDLPSWQAPQPYDYSIGE